MLLKTFSLVTCLKLLVLPAYKSTDYEVHRNWLAITYSNPISKWYYEDTSEWTLDYPPLFAWFEYTLSQIAYYFDSNMLVTRNLNYNSLHTQYFQRLSVMFSDLLLAYGCKEITDFISVGPIRRKSSKWKTMWGSPASTFYILVLANFGLFIVDHIHFQYNGFLLGILLISIAKILKEEYLWGTLWFCILLNLKHIYIYMAPAYGVYLLKNYCLVFNESNKLQRSSSSWRLLKLISVSLLVTSVSIGPFMYMGQLRQMFSRLFPFKRGLCHSYWAPNFWAFYNLIDKGLTIAVSSFYPNVKYSYGAMTSGLVQNYEHNILPNITPSMTAVLVVITMMPCLWKLWYSPGNPLHFVRAVIVCTSCSFLFGWHVHEKAVLMVLIPMSIMAVLRRSEAEVFIFLSIVGHYSLLPLIFSKNEYLINLIMLTLYTFFVIYAITDLFRIRSFGPFPLLSNMENIYLRGLCLLFFYENMIHNRFKYLEKYPFLPLLLTSSYCSVGIMYSTFKYYQGFLKMELSEHKQKMF